MDERYQIAESKCVEKILTAAFKDQPDTGGKLKDQLTNLLVNTIKVAFSDGYDVGYCNGVDDTKDID